MNNNSLVELFALVRLLSGNKAYTMQEISDKMGIALRSAYYYVESLGRNGFTIQKTNKRYKIDPRSPFYQSIGASMPFTDTEAEMVLRVLATVDDSNKIALAAKEKLVRYYNLASVASPDGQEERKRKLDVINEAIVKKRMLLIKGYSSPHSQTKKDRIVEPFLLMYDGMDLRAHEVSSHMNKTFKLSRMTDVEVLDSPWISEKEHRKVYTDLFAFSGEEIHHVKILMGQLSHNLMLEEHPRSNRCFVQQDEKHWLFETDVVSYLGIGRFVLGLYDDVEIVEDEGLRTFIKEKIQNMLER